MTMASPLLRYDKERHGTEFRRRACYTLAEENGRNLLLKPRDFAKINIAEAVPLR
jgi:hypothetical protein